MLLPTLTPDLNLHTLQHPPLQLLIPDIHPHERAMRRIKVIRLDSFPDFIDFVRWQRYRIGN